MQNIPFFCDFTYEDLFETAQLSSWLKFMPGDYIVKEGDCGSAFWIILKGTVRVEKGIPGKVSGRSSRLSPPANASGKCPSFRADPVPANIVAHEEVFLYKLDAHSWKTAENPSN